MIRIPNGAYSAADILRLARELNVPGTLVRRGRLTETRAYAVALESGAIFMWKVTAAPDKHYTGRAPRIAPESRAGVVADVNVGGSRRSAGSESNASERAL